MLFFLQLKLELQDRSKYNKFIKIGKFSSIIQYVLVLKYGLKRIVVEIIKVKLLSSFSFIFKIKKNIIKLEIAITKEKIFIGIKFSGL